MGLIAALNFTEGIRIIKYVTMKLLLLITFVAIAMAGEPAYPVPVVYPNQQHWPTLYGSNFASTCWGCRVKRSAEPEPEAQLYQFPLIHHALSGHVLIPKEAPEEVAVVPAAPAVVPTYIHGVHTVASALDLKNSVPVPVGAPAPKYGNIVVPTVPAAPVVPVPAAPVVPALPVPAHPVYPAVPLPAYPVLPVAPVAPVDPAAPVAPVAPVKLGAAVHPEGILGHVERSPQGLSDFTRLNLFESHIPVLSALPTVAEAPASEDRRKRSAEPDLLENFYRIHGEYPKAFVAGPGIRGAGVTGISTVFDVRSSPFGQIG